jgi:hypothetical protein
MQFSMYSIPSVTSCPLSGLRRWIPAPPRLPACLSTRGRGAVGVVYFIAVSLWVGANFMAVSLGRGITIFPPFLSSLSAPFPAPSLHPTRKTGGRGPRRPHPLYSCTRPRDLVPSGKRRTRAIARRHFGVRAARACARCGMDFWRGLARCRRCAPDVGRTRFRAVGA